jgi:hypothetical protein
MAYTYATLSAALQTWAERTYTQAQVDEFIMLAEANFNRRLAGYQRQVTGTIALTNGVGTLPTGFLRFISVAYTGGDACTATDFSISGNQITTALTSYSSLDVTYAASLAGLSGTNSTNWLLDLAPDAYLFMCRAMQLAFEEDPAAVAYEAKANQILMDVGLQTATAQYGRTGFRIHGPTP